MGVGRLFAAVNTRTRQTIVFGEPGRDQQRAELVAVQPCNVRFIIEPGSADVRGRGVLEQVAGQKGRRRDTLAVAQQRREPTPDSRR
jgi:hypothetical protein